MSKEVKRYNFDVDKFGSPRAYESEHGRWVKRDAYDALLAERNAAQKDAERYRWLRQRLVGASFDWDDEGMTVLAFEMPDGVSIGADCDKNIDAARAALQGEQP
ncbi:hypothetical protein B382_23693 [Stutzerimonas stutzeri B1SMN1]|nr:hypothetical protein B382_23693 [Stutzerimonas stutzeri B1SMN1]